MVRFFHEAWDRPSKELLCKTVDQMMLANNPADLTTKTIRKHFPQCEACPADNMVKQPISRSTSGRVFVSEEEFQVDIKVWANRSKVLKHRKVSRGFTGALTAVDLSTLYKIRKILKPIGASEVELEALRVETDGTEHAVKVLRIDNQFRTKPVTT